MNKILPSNIVQCFNRCIQKMRKHNHLANQSEHALAERELSDVANELLSKTLESILTNYKIDLIKNLTLDAKDFKIISDHRSGVLSVFDVIEKYKNIKKINIDISDVDISFLKGARNTQRNKNVHSADGVASYAVIEKSIEEIRKWILSYVDKNAVLDPIKKPKIKLKTALNNAKKNNFLSDETIQVLDRNSDVEIETPELPVNVTEDPVFSCFIFDESYSMNPHRQAVIDSHPVLLETLRSSAKCRNDALYVIQYSFSDTTKSLNSFEKLDANKNDSVAILSENNYRPSGRTALYQTILKLLQEMAVVIDTCENEGIAATFTIAIITDGGDTEGVVFPAEIKTVINDLKQNGCLRKSVVLGLLGSSFSKAQLDNVKTTLGFDESISIDNDQKAIRRAFQMASESSIS